MTLGATIKQNRCGVRNFFAATAEAKPQASNHHRDTLRDRWSAMRDRWLTSPAFNRWSFAIPGIRSVARNETRALFDICAGFVYSQVLLACVRLDLFSMVRAGPLPSAEIAARTLLPLASVERLLIAAASLRLLERRSAGRFGLGALGAAVAANPSIAAMVEHHATLYADLYDPVALLGADKPQTQMAAYWPYATGQALGGLDGDQVAKYTALMATSQVMIAAEILEAYDFRSHTTVLDVGGGNGTFVSALAKHAPHLTLKVFDLPAVAALATARIETDGLADRVTAIGGDFYADPLPQGCDLITLVRVLFDHDDASAVRILRAVHAALPKHGTLLIAEPMSGTRGAEPIGDAYFSFYLLAMGRGVSRTPHDFMRLLAKAGFAAPRTIATQNPLLTKLIAVQPKKATS
jgi:demethylspheroidene O-methyltransferase